MNIGQSVQIEVQDKVYTFSPFTLDILNQFVEWANLQLPSPLDIVGKNFNSYPAAMQDLLVTKALAQAATRKDYSSPEIQSILNSIDGIAKVMSLLLAKNHPEMTDKQARQLFQDCLDEHGLPYLEKAFAKAHGKVEVKETDAERETMEDLGLLPVLKKKKIADK